MEKSCRKCAPKCAPKVPFLILVNNCKQPLHARNYFKNKIFWKRIIKQPEKVNFSVSLISSLYFLLEVKVSRCVLKGHSYLGSHVLCTRKPTPPPFCNANWGYGNLVSMSCQKKIWTSWWVVIILVCCK